MKFKFTTKLGTGDLEFTSDTLEGVYLTLNKLGVIGDKKLFMRMNDMNRLPIPSVCPIDGEPVRLVTREAGKGSNKFTAYEVISTGPHRFRMSLGVHREEVEGKELFIREADGWTYYDRDRQEQRVVFQYGRIIYENLPDGFEVPAAQAALYPAGEYIPKDGEAAPAPRQQAPSGGDETRRAKAKMYLLDLAVEAGIPKAGAFKAYSVFLSDEDLKGNAFLDVPHAEQIHAAVKEDKAAFLESLKSAFEFAQTEFDSPSGDADDEFASGMPF